MDKKKKVSVKKKEGVFISKDNLTSISILVILVIIIACFSVYLAGMKAAFLMSNQDPSKVINPKSIGGYASANPISECVFYSDDVWLSDVDCDNHIDCAPNGICLEEYGKCGFFVN